SSAYAPRVDQKNKTVTHPSYTCATLIPVSLPPHLPLILTKDHYCIIRAKHYQVSATLPSKNRTRSAPYRPIRTASRSARAGGLPRAQNRTEPSSGVRAHVVLRPAHHGHPSRRTAQGDHQRARAGRRRRRGGRGQQRCRSAGTSGGGQDGP